MSEFLSKYKEHVQERADLGVVPLALDATQTAELIELLKAPEGQDQAELMDLFTNRIPAGVDDASYVKASFLSAITALICIR